MILKCQYKCQLWNHCLLQEDYWASIVLENTKTRINLKSVGTLYLVMFKEILYANKNANENKIIISFCYIALCILLINRFNI